MFLVSLLVSYDEKGVQKAIESGGTFVTVAESHERISEFHSPLEEYEAKN